MAVGDSPAAAQTTYVGTTAGKPTWNRPIEGSPPTQLSAQGTAAPYDDFTFTVSANAAYNLVSAAGAPAGWDNDTFLYAGLFNPVSPFANIVRGNDDLGKTGVSGFSNIAPQAGITYHFVTTGFANTDFGTYTDTISPLNSPPRTFTTTGTTVNAPTWNRPIANGSLPPTALSSFAAKPHFSALSFVIDITGSYDLISTALAPSGWNDYTFLYSDAFEPSKPLSHVLLGKESLEQTGISGFRDVTLTAGRKYYFVTTGFSSGDFGTFTTTISDVGNVVPEPGAWAALSAFVSVGLGLKHGRTRRKFRICV